MSKVADHKKNTLQSFARGKCDSPLCDQVLFLYLWMKDNRPDWLAAAPPGAWVCDRNRGYTNVEQRRPDTARQEFLGIQPTWIPRVH